VITLLFLLLWPVIEIAGFIVVGREIGVLSTIALIFASGMIGAMLMRYQGFGVLARIQKEIDAGRNPGRDMAHGVMILLAGLLLLLPGFVSDLLGLALFIPPVRELAWRLLRKRINFAEIRVSPGFSRNRDRGPTLDLDASDYTAGPNPDSPWKPIDRDKRDP